MAIRPKMGMKLRGLLPRPDLSIREEREKEREREREREKDQPSIRRPGPSVRRKSLASRINF